MVSNKLRVVFNFELTEQVKCRGIGNGHMVMLEKNNLQIADFLHQWMISNIKN